MMSVTRRTLRMVSAITALNGGSHLYEYVGDLNLFTRPWPHLTIVPSLRVQQQNSDATSSGFETLSDFQPEPFAGLNNASDLDVRERLDVTYNGITNWVFYARGELTEGSGTLAETGWAGSHQRDRSAAGEL